jgi:hypothetical protein
MGSLNCSRWRIMYMRSPIRGSVSRFCCGTNVVEDDELLPPPTLKPPPLPSGPPPTLMLIELTFPQLRLAFTDCEFTIFFLFGPLFRNFRLSRNTTSLLPRLTDSPHDMSIHGSPDPSIETKENSLGRPRAEIWL